MFTKNKSLSTDLSTSIPQRRSIFAILVHFGASKTTNAAITSLLTGKVRPNYIIVVDHTDAVMPGSDPASTRTGFRLEGRNDTVIVIRPETNTGYAGGLQAGITQASALGVKASDICILLNNDILFESHSLQRIVDWWGVHGGSRVLAGALEGYVSLFSGRAHIAHTKKRATRWDIHYIHGSCMVGEFQLFTSLVFPLSFFMYWEDVVLSILVRQYGGTLLNIPGLHTIHNDKQASISPKKLFYLVRNGAYVLEQYVSPIWKVYWYILNSIRMAYHFIYGGARHTIIARALYAARLGRIGKVDV